MDSKIPSLKPPTKIVKLGGVPKLISTIISEKKSDGPSTSQSISRNLLRRRSKSVADLRSVMTKQPKPTIMKAKPGKPLEPQPVRTAQKRLLPDRNEATKPKVAKVKIPDWDYKSRFLELQKKYGVLQEDMKDLRSKTTRLASLETDHEALREVEQIQNEKIEALNKKEITMTATVQQLTREKTVLESKLSEIEERHQCLKDKYDTILKKNEEDVLRLKSMTATVQQLTGEKTVLECKLSEIEEHHQCLKDKYDTVFKKNEEDVLRIKSLENDFAMSNLKTKNLQMKFEQLKDTNRHLKQDLEQHDNLRRYLHNTIQDLKGNIRVFCRVRPPVNTEEQERQLCATFFPSDTSFEIRKSRESVSCISGKPVDLKQEFNFDKVFPPEATQSEVFEELSQLVQSALDGYHVCVFAYGQTGSGKTYTMEGTSGDNGMIQRTIDLLFEKINQLIARTDWSYSVSASFLEIYNESIRDLLVPNSTHNYELRFNEGRGVTVTNLKTLSISSAHELKKLMDEAHKNRAVAATDINEHSSRSHAVTKIEIEGFNSMNSVVYSGSINLVDLAGSESAKTSSTNRLAETKSINKSLSTLGSVMLSLHNRDSHIPYRNSKLTFLLQSCLGGNSKTLMIVNISPFEECYAESINSLRFASQVKEVKTCAKKNKTSHFAHV